MVSLKRISFKSFQGPRVLFLLTLLLFSALPAAGAGWNGQHDLSPHLERSEINLEISSPTAYTNLWHQNSHQSDRDRAILPPGEKSIPPVDLRLNNEPAGEDERKLLPNLIAPLATSIPKVTRQKSLQPIPLGLSLFRDLALQSLSTVILLN